MEGEFLVAGRRAIGLMNGVLWEGWRGEAEATP